MGKLILVTGGSRSGKSGFAESLLAHRDNVLYIATAQITDTEMAERIELHRERRNSKWRTFEGYKALDIVLYETDRNYIMLDCVTVMITNLMFDKHRDFDNITKTEIRVLEEEILNQFNILVEAAKAENKTLILVTNEVGCSIVPEYRLGRIFRDIAGRVNQRLGAVSDEVYLVTCGIPLKIKGEK